MKFKLHHIFILAIVLIGLKSSVWIRFPHRKSYRNGNVSPAGEQTRCGAPSFHIFLIGCERLALRDVYEYVHKASYLDKCVALTVLIDQPWDPSQHGAETNHTRLVKWAHNLEWPHGPSQYVIQATRQGIKNTWLRHIQSNARYIVVLEDDLRVDPVKFVQSMYGSARFLDSTNHLFSVALHAAPAVNEYIGYDFQVARVRTGAFNVSRALSRLPKDVATICNATYSGALLTAQSGYCHFGAMFDFPDARHQAVALQTCSSWGTIFSGLKWRQFVEFAAFSRALPLRTGVFSDFWTDSWKAMATVFILLRDELVLYPGYHTVATRPVSEVGPSVHGGESLDPRIRVFLLSADMSYRRNHHHNFSANSFPTYDIFGEPMLTSLPHPSDFACSLFTYWHYALAPRTLATVLTLAGRKWQNFQNCKVAHPYHVKLIIANFDDDSVTSTTKNSPDTLPWPQFKRITLSYKNFCSFSQNRDDTKECRPIQYLPDNGPLVFEGEWTLFHQSNVTFRPRRMQMLEYIHSKETRHDNVQKSSCWMGKCSDSLNAIDWILCRPRHFVNFTKTQSWGGEHRLLSFGCLIKQLRDVTNVETQSIC